MSPAAPPDHAPEYARRLAEWLPALWRERDQDGDLGRLLAVYGELLDALHATVEQRRYDNFPDQDPNHRHCQDWLLPYFAQLLDVRLVSPDLAGRRAELRDAVAWRQRKGTRVSIEKIAEAVGQFEVEVQEGWQRVAITPCVDRPLLPETNYGEAPIDRHASLDQHARHPGLPAATVDLRYCSRAVLCGPDNPAAHQTKFGGDALPLPWRQIHRHGNPCAPGSFQDVSRRTVDLRHPDGRRGHAHPRRVALYLPPPQGFFTEHHAALNWHQLAAAVADYAATDVGGWPADKHLSQQIGEVELTLARGVWNAQVLPQITLRALTSSPLRLFGVITLDRPAAYRFENLWLDHKLQVEAGAVKLLNCAARHLKVFTAERAVPVVDARACLFKKVEAARGLVRLEYVTVLDTLLAETLEASDCILLPPLRKDTVDDDVPAAGCLRYSRLPYLPLPAVRTDPPVPGQPLVDNDPAWRSQGKRSPLQCFATTCHSAPPLFWNEQFGHPGCAVLHPDCTPAIQFGAEDGGEMGACHDYRYVLRQRAVLDKLQEFLPVGIEAVLVTDPSLACRPPKVTQP